MEVCKRRKLFIYIDDICWYITIWMLSLRGFLLWNSYCDHSGFCTSLINTHTFLNFMKSPTILWELFQHSLIFDRKCVCEYSISFWHSEDIFRLLASQYINSHGNGSMSRYSINLDEATSKVSCVYFRSQKKSINPSNTPRIQWIGAPCIIQSSAVLTRYNLSQHHIRHCDNSGRECIGL